MKDLRDVNLSFSQIKQFKRCPWRWNQSYNVGVRRRTEKMNLRTGDFIHRLLRDMFLTSLPGTWRDTWAAIRSEYEDAQLFEEEIEEIAGLSDRVYKIVDRYERQVYLPLFSAFEVLHIEEELVIPAGPTIPFAVAIKPDLVLENSDGIWLIDHKTTMDFDEDLEMNLRYDDQVTLYLWGLRELGYKVMGAYHDLIRTRLPRFPDVLKDGSRFSKQACVTDAETVREAAAYYNGQGAALILDSAVEEYISTMKMGVFFKQIMTARSDDVLTRMAKEYRYTRGQMRFCTNSKSWPRTFIPRDCPQCPLRELCMADLQGGDVGSLMETTYRLRDEEPVAPTIPAEVSEEGGQE